MENCLPQANKPLRQGYGLSSQEISQVLSWQHGEDVSETCRKKLNAKINSLIQVCSITLDPNDRSLCTKNCLYSTN